MTVRGIVAAIFVWGAVAAFAQPANTPAYNSQEVSEIDGIPVLIKHLPDWENVRATTVFARSTDELKAALGERPVLNAIDWAAGTEAVTAHYAVGRLLIVEYSSPQGSIDADARFREALNGDPSSVYRRIGNYNAVVFDAADNAAANALLDQVKYEKQVQWLGNNPFRISAERAFVLTTTDIFISTVMVVMVGIGVALVGGAIVGFFYFRFTDRRRSDLAAFTDAGGMTRLNLDGLSADLPAKRLLD